MQIKINNILNTIPNIYPKRFVPVKNNLSPLESDVVTFSGKGKNFSATDMIYSASEKQYREISANAAPAVTYLDNLLKILLQDQMINKDDITTSNNPILEIKVRSKTPSSIREKVVSNYSAMLKKEFDSFINDTYDAFSQSFRKKESENADKIKAVLKKNLKEMLAGSDNPLYLNANIYIKNLYNSVCDYFCPTNNEKALLDNIIEAFQEKGQKSHNIQNNAYVDPRTDSGIKNYAQDIVGARIILDRCEPKDIINIIQLLKKAANINIENSNVPLLNIKSVECFVPDEKKLPPNSSLSDYTYAPDYLLKQLDPEYKKGTKSKSGYLAIHINVDLSNKILGSVDNNSLGYSGEIQIIGKDVAALKTVEDLCYKLKDNKQNINPIFTPFKEYFFKFYKSNVKKAFDNYTYALYLHQRRIPAGCSESSFPSIKDLGFQGQVPEELDFNVLKMNYDNCCEQETRSLKDAIPKNKNLKRISQKITNEIKKNLDSVN